MNETIPDIMLRRKSLAEETFVPKGDPLEARRVIEETSKQEYFSFEFYQKLIHKAYIINANRIKLAVEREDKDQLLEIIGEVREVSNNYLRPPEIYANDFEEARRQYDDLKHQILVNLSNPEKNINTQFPYYEKIMSIVEG